MTDLIDVPTVVDTLFTLFTGSPTDAILAAAKGMTVNGTVKLLELKDELIEQAEIGQAVRVYQENPLNPDSKSQLKDMLTQALEQHPAFQQQMVVNVNEVKAEGGSVASAVITGGTINITNNKN